jgi:hypothetical protein
MAIPKLPFHKSKKITLSHFVILGRQHVRWKPKLILSFKSISSIPNILSNIRKLLISSRLLISCDFDDGIPADC